MLLRRLEVRGVRCFDQRVTLGPFVDGLNMIHGPNESGKSTLMEAMARAVFDRYSVGGADIQELRPRGSSLSPEVTVEFEWQQRCYRLHKRFIDDPRSVLEIYDGTRWVARHERDAADDYVRQIFSGEVAGRGLTPVSGWGLARTLWMLQRPGGSEHHGVSDAVAAQLRSALAGQLQITTRLDAVAERVEAAYREDFTPTGKIRKGSRLQELDDGLSARREQLEEARRRMEEADRTVQRMESVESELERLAQERCTVVSDLEVVESEVARVEKMRDEVRARREALSEQRDRLDRLEQNLCDVQAALATIARGERSLEAMEGEREQIALRVQSMEYLVHEADSALSRARSARTEAERALRHGIRALDVLGEWQKYRALCEQHERVWSLSEALHEAEKELAREDAPTEEEIEQLQDVEREADRLRAMAEASSLRVHMHAHVAQPVKCRVDQVDDADETTRVLDAGEQHEVSGLDRINLSLPGVMDLDIASGSSQARDLRRRVDQLEAEACAQCDRLGIASAKEGRDRRARSQAIERRIEQLREKRAHALGGYDDAASLQTAAREAERRVEEGRQRMGWADEDLSQYDSPVLRELQETADKARRDEEQAQGIYEERKQNLEEKREEQVTLSAKLREIQGEIDTAETTVRAVLGSIGCPDPDTLAHWTEEAREQTRTLEEEVGQLEAELPGEEEDPSVRRDTVRAALCEIEKREKSLEHERIEVGVALDSAKTRGAYEEAVKIEEEIAEMETTLARHRQRAWGVYLLRSILTKRREAAMTEHLPGLEREIARMMTRITRRPRTVALDGTIRPRGVESDRGEWYARDALSSGTAEQLDLVMRLAIGRVYSRHITRTMVVLDDALLYTDPERHDRIKELLKVLSADIQVLLLTSHPARYRGIIDEEGRFDLAALRLTEDSSLGRG